MNKKETELFGKKLKQLEYVMKRVDILERDLLSFLNKPGHQKSYGTKCRQVQESLKNLKQEIKIWNSEGLLPEVLSKEF